MERIKVVVHYANGEVTKGFTQDFSPNKNVFHLHQTDNPKGKGIEVSMEKLKAVFFVRDFIGDPQHNERKGYIGGENIHGRKLKGVFMDGELFVGSTLGYNPGRQGFFLFPADPESNNLRVFILTSSLKDLHFL